MSDSLDNKPADDAAPRFEALRARLRQPAQWARENRLQSLIAGALSVLLLLAVVAIWPKSLGSIDTDEPSIATALEALDDRAYTEAREIAEKLRESETLPDDDLGAPLYILGAVVLHDAENVPKHDQQRFYTLAAEHLEEARDRGFPEGRRPDGLYLLGKSLFMAGQLARSRPILLEAIKTNERHRTELHRLAALAYLRDGAASKKIALAEIDNYLADDSLSPPERREGLLIKSQTQFEAGDYTAATESLKEIPLDTRNASQVALLHGRIAIARARQSKKKNNVDLANAQFDDAIKHFREAQGKDTLGSVVTRQAMYLIGAANRERGNVRAALEQFVRTRKQHFDAPVGLVASLGEADVFRQLGKNEEAVEAYRRTLNMAGSADGFKNEWISLVDFRKRIHTAYQDYIESKDFQPAFDVAERTYPIFSRVEQMHMAAGARRLWAKSLLESAESLYGQKARAMEQDARRQLRKAGHIFARLARLRIATRHYPDDIWKGATSFLDGQDYKNAVKLLRIYRENEHRAHSAEALVGLGEALLALGQIDEAIEAFQECIDEYPRHAATYRARLLGSKAYAEKEMPEEAQKLLLVNLNSELTPESHEWRDSLFSLGKLLYTSGEYEKAVEKLEEAVARYPDTRQALEARYLIAEAYRAAAKKPERFLDSDTIQTARVAHMRQMQQLLDKALAQYGEIRRILNRRQETSKLTALESVILRNCYFAQGAALYNLRRYEEAIEAYSTATNRYQNDPDVLAAFLQISDCYRRLGKRAAARGNIERAKLVLSRFPQDVDFAKATNFTRQEWTDLLELYSRL
ncbi:MAG: tetratricopeptide repeat protein [Pirellulales bacterium]|nr:tetratricopeptide repeat protein [Pirellulales bacterium]